MKRILKFTAIGLAACLLAAQLVRPEFKDPPVIEADRLEAVANPPERIKALLRRSCMDCHSNETVYPWYSTITPFSWFLAGHIEEGRAEVNFSEWGTYDDSRKARKLEQICDETRAGEMPLPSYLWIHRSAALAQDDVDLLCSWTEAERTRVGE